MKQVRKWFGMLLVIWVVCMAFPIGANAAMSGTCGTNVTWSLNGSVLTVSGTGAMTNYADYSSVPWADNRDEIKSVVIEDGITSIGAHAFNYCRKMTSVTIPDSVKTICAYAFKNCDYLGSVKIPNSVTSIRDGAFAYGGLRSVEISESVTSIGDFAFGFCSSLKEITVSENNQYYSSEDGVLFSKKKERLIAYPAGATRTSYVVPDCVTAIGTRAFTAAKFSNISLPYGVVSIGNEAFEFSALTRIRLPESVKYLGTGVLSWCDELTDVTLPSGLISIPAEMFTASDGLTTVVIPEKVTQIGAEAFVSCDNLTTITLPQKVTAIGESAFDGCDNLHDISIPAGVTSIGYRAFCFCDSLAEVYYGGSSEDWAKISIADGNDPLEAAKRFPFTQSANTDLSDGTYIIGRVNEYTTEKMYAQWDEIVNSSESNEVKHQQLVELFSKNNGFLNVQEGVSFLSSTTENRSAYKMLISDETYCAQNYFKWLHDPRGDGLVARTALIFDGLIFNSEFSDWVDLTTYIEGDYPGVKKYRDMLYDFMDAESLKIEAMAYISGISKLSKNCTNAGKIYAEILIEKINDCSSTEALSELVRSADMLQIFRERTNADLVGDSLDTCYVTYDYKLDNSSGFGQFSEAMGHAAQIISFSNLMATHVVDLMELDAKLAIYMQYEEFLNEIELATELPLEMRLAAKLILKELDEGAWGVMKNAVVDIFDMGSYVAQEVSGIKIDEIVLDKILGSVDAKSLRGWFLALKVGSFCINQVVDVGEIAKGIAYLEGYVYLQNHYKQKLQESRTVFMDVPTAENSWEYFKDYNTLFQLRYKGEEAYLRMSKVKGIASWFTDFGYAVKSKVVEETLESLKTKCEFTIDEDVEIPPSAQYASKVIFDCPVDLNVYAPDGTLVASLLDGKESDVINEHGRFAVVYRPYTGEYAKVACFNEQADYSFESIGLDKGLLGFEMAVAGETETKLYAFNHVEVSSNAVFQTGIDQIMTSQSFDVDMDGDEVFEGSGTIREQSAKLYQPVENITLSSEALRLKKGQSALLNVSVFPATATYQNVVWMSNCPEVVDVFGGKVVAREPGTAKIYCMAQDDFTVISACDVTVENTEINEVTRTDTSDGATLWVSLETDAIGDEEALLMAGVYNEGRLIQVRSLRIGLIAGTYALPLEKVNADADIKVFLISPTTYEPLADAVSVSCPQFSTTKID